MGLGLSRWDERQLKEERGGRGKGERLREKKRAVNRENPHPVPRLSCLSESEKQAPRKPSQLFIGAISILRLEGFPLLFGRRLH